MEKIIRSFFIAFLLFYSQNIAAQIPEEVRDAIEKYLENTETNADYTQLVDELTAYLEKPIPLNSASIDELLRFPLISAAEAIDIIDHRNTFGLFLHLHELQVLGFTPERIRLLQHFITISKSPEQQLQDVIKQLGFGEKQAISTWKIKYPLPVDDSFSGNRSAQNIRLRYSFPGMYSFGFSADKDPGEAYWNKGPDFYSAHACLQNIGKMQSLVLGDYLLSFGQGLVVGSGIGMGKSALVTSTKRTASNLRPYRGVNEFMFHRGAAVSMKFGKYQTTFAYSINSLDTRLASDTNASGIGFFNSLDLDGLHRNQSEISGKGNTHRSMAGTWIQRQGKMGNWGLGGNYFHYNHSVKPADDWYKHFYPSGNSLAFLHIFQAHTIRRFHVFSEWAWCPTNNTKAGLAGLLTTFGRYTEASLIWRHYDPGFVSPFSTAFGNNTQNEQGLYAGIKINFSARLWLSHYTDIWTNPWLNYRMYGAARGRDMLWQLDMVPMKKAQVYLRFRLLNKPQAVTGAEPVKEIEQNEIKSLRLHVNTPLSKTSTLQLRGETAISNNHGLWHSSLVFAQWSQATNNNKTRITLRYSLFDVDNYYNRIFAYENQLQYDFGTAAFYGKGYSMYLLVQQKINRHWKAGVRGSTTQSVAPGETQLQTRTGLYLQLVYGG